jgi:catechol 2,3-dioxygenase-like lactoylglutathione lyase family enzyme
MKMSSIAGVVCYVKDLDATAAFYEKLGFRLKREADKLTAYVNWFWITFRAEEAEERPEGTEEAYRANRASGTYLYIKVEDIQQFYDGVQEKGFASPLTAVGTGRPAAR